MWAMHLVLFEGPHWSQLAPLSLSRPVCMLTLGSRTLLERIVARLRPERVSLWMRPELQPTFQRLLPKLDIPISINQPLDGNPALLLNARTVIVGEGEHTPCDTAKVHPGEGLRASLGSGSGLCPVDAMKQDSPWHEFVRGCTVEPIGRVAHSLADLIHWNAQAIADDFAEANAGSAPAELPTGPFHLVNPAQLRLGSNVKLEPGCVLDASTGPILIGDSVNIGANSLVKGPCAVGSCAVIAPLSQIRGGTSIGHACRVGGEMSASIMLSYSNKAHEGYLGHSYIGEWVNLGAGTTTSNLKNTYGDVVLRLGSRRMGSGRQFLGSLIGDHAKTGILTRLMTGTYVGFCSMLAGSASPPPCVASFTFLTDQGSAPYRIDKAAEVAQRVASRRGITWTAEDTALMHYVAKIAPHVET